MAGHTDDDDDQDGDDELQLAPLQPNDRQLPTWLGERDDTPRSSTPTGTQFAATEQPPCPNCGAPLKHSAYVCVECAYDLRAGRVAEIKRPDESVFALDEYDSGVPWWVLAIVLGVCLFVVGNLILVIGGWRTLLVIFNAIYLLGAGAAAAAWLSNRSREREAQEQEDRIAARETKSDQQ